LVRAEGIIETVRGMNAELEVIRYAA
jgi:hypothetical protein